MNTTELRIEKNDVHKLLSAASGDAALLYLYLSSGNDLGGAETALGLNGSRMGCAVATLRQLGLWPEERSKVVLAGERPRYSEADVLSAADTDSDFRSLYGEVQRILGRTLTNEELKILLGFSRYLGLPNDVISLLLTYCLERARQKGRTRAPSLRSIEKEAYAWAEMGIDTFEEATAYIRKQAVRNTRLGKLMEQLQIKGRSLTPGEERYAQQWLDMGFDEEAIAMAYERTCLNTGGLSWAYMNKILTRWHEAGQVEGQQIRQGDQKALPKGASGRLGQAELEAIQRILREG